jgi:hypothetical protein
MKRRAYGPSAADRLEPWVLGGSLLAYLLLTLFRFESPGFHWDGLRTVVRAVNYVDDWRRIADGYPLYHGSFHSLLLFPLFLLWEPNWVMLKLWNPAFNALALLFCHAFLRNVFSKPVALATVTLLAVHPAFVLASRVYADGAGSIMFYTMGCLFMLERWWALHKARWLVGAMLLLGFGLGTFLWFLWFAAGLALAALVFRKELARRLDPRSAAAAAAGLVPGLLPILTYEFASGFQSWGHVFNHAKGSSWSAPLVETGFANSFSGEMFFLHMFDLSSRGSFLYAPLALLAFLGLFRKALSGPKAGKSPLLLLLIVFGAMGLLMSLAGLLGYLSLPNAVPMKYLLLYPAPQLFIVLAAREALAWRPLPRAAAALALAALLGTEAATLAAYARAMRETCGRGRSTDAIYELADWLNRRTGPDDRIIASELVANNLRLHLPREKDKALTVVRLAAARAGDIPRGAAKNVYYVTVEMRQMPNLLEKTLKENSFEKLRDFEGREGRTIFSVHRYRPFRSPAPPKMLS